MLLGSHLESLGHVYLEMGKLDEAIQVFNESEGIYDSLDPSPTAYLPDLALGFGKAAIALGDVSFAKKQFERAAGGFADEDIPSAQATTELPMRLLSF